MAGTRKDIIEGIIFSLPPSANACWRSVKGRTILSEKYRKWKADNLHGPKYGDHNMKASWPCHVVISVFRGAGWRKSDLDNRIKPILDQLKTCEYITDDNTDYVHSVLIRLSGIAGEDMDSYVSVDLVQSEGRC